MTQVDIKYLEDKDGNQIAPITHVNAVRDSNGDTLPEILDRDYPTTSKTPVEGSSEVSLVTRGEKYDYDKVNNATDVSGASGIGANLKYILLNGTTGEFEAALGSYVEEKVRSALGGLLHNLNKASVSSANLDVACIEHIPADANAGTPESYDFGSLSAAQLASVLGVLQHTRLLQSTENLDNIHTQGIYTIASGNPSNSPVTWPLRAWLFVWSTYSETVQVIFNMFDAQSSTLSPVSRVYVRSIWNKPSSNPWSPWKEL